VRRHRWSAAPSTACPCSRRSRPATSTPHGGGRVDGPADTPWNTRDLTTADPDGTVVIFTAARPPELTDPAFSEQMRRRSAEQG
jgi:hypothetical protein